MTFKAVDKIYDPEPDNYNITYDSAVFNKIPSNLFSKKKSTIGSSFINCNNITEIPEDLFKDCINVEAFTYTFRYCDNIRTIPENLFKYNTKVKIFYETFVGYKGENIPENLFKYNTKVDAFYGTFFNSSIKTIPENLFKYNTEVNNFSYTFGNTKITQIPANLFAHNNQITNVSSLFYDCTSLLEIPQEIINKVLASSENSHAFRGCTSASNYNSLPNKLK